MRIQMHDEITAENRIAVGDADRSARAREWAKVYGMEVGGNLPDGSVEVLPNTRVRDVPAKTETNASDVHKPPRWPDDPALSRAKTLLEASHTRSITKEESDQLHADQTAASASGDVMLLGVLKLVENAVGAYRAGEQTLAVTNLAQSGDAATNQKPEATGYAAVLQNLQPPADGRSVFSSNKTGYVKVLENLQLTGRQAMIFRSQHSGLLPGEGGGK